MQSVVLYGRLLARAIVNGISSEYQLRKTQAVTAQQQLRQQRELCHLATASSGYGNHSSTSPAQVIRKWTFGDDACFVARNKLADVIGVADGVGGWRSYGIDPSQFSKSFMQACQRMVQEGHFCPQEPAGIIAAGYTEILESKNPLIGSCTACLVALHKAERTIYTANLGDSGFILVRGNKVVHRSEEQQHYFNTPFQLSVAPPTQQGLVLSDSPDSAISTSFPVEEGDIILLGTDGLFDNLTDDMILDHLDKLKCDSLDSIQTTADQLVNKAVKKAFDPDYLSPFSMAAREHGIDCKGGKPDDVTVLLATVQKGELLYST